MEPQGVGVQRSCALQPDCQRWKSLSLKLESMTVVLRLRSAAQQFRASFQARRWQWLMGLAFFALVNGYIGYRLYQDRDQIAKLWNTQIEPTWLGLAFIVQTAGVLIAVGSWGGMLRRSGYDIPLRIHFRIYALSNLAARLPGIGMVAISRSFLYGQRGVDGVQVAVLSLIEPPVFGFAGVIVALVTLLLPGSMSEYANPWLLAGMLATLLLLLPSPLFRRFLDWLVARHPAAILRWQHLLIWVLCNIATIILGGTALYLVCRSVSFIPESALILLIQCWALLIVTGSLLFWIPFDLGVTSSVMVIILSTMMPVPQALLIMVIWRVWGVLVDLTWGAAGLTL